jgi:hypothetical protein
MQMQMQFVRPERATSHVPRRSHGRERVETTLGDLIVALTEETHRFVSDEQETYELVAYLLSERLTRRATSLPNRAPR